MVARLLLLVAAALGARHHVVIHEDGSRSMVPASRAEDSRLGTTNAVGVERWEAQQRRYYPGREHGATTVSCGSYRWRRSEGRGAWVARVLRAAYGDAAARSLASLEIGPCGNPTPLPPGLFARSDAVDAPGTWESPRCAPPPGANGTVAPYRPTYVDDASRLALVKSSSYDVVIAAHVLEHLARPLGALASWLRVLRPGGLLLVAHPDPCERALMDRYRRRGRRRGTSTYLQLEC